MLNDGLQNHAAKSGRNSIPISIKKALGQYCKAEKIDANCLLRDPLWTKDPIYQRLPFLKRSGFICSITKTSAQVLVYRLDSCRKRDPQRIPKASSEKASR
jgi:hypothetical protein